MFKLAVRNIRQHRVRTILTMLGITLASALILAMGILNESIMHYYEGKISEVTGKADITMFSSDRIYPLKGDVVAKLERQDGVLGVTPTLPVQAKFNVGSDRETISLVGVDPTRDPRFKDYSFTQGEWFGSRSEREIIINQGAAQAYGLSVGQVMKVHLPDGTERDKRIIGILDEVGAGNTNEQVLGLVPLAELQQDMQTEKIGAIDIYTRPGTNVERLVQDLQVAFPHAKFSDLIKVKENVFARSGLASIEKAFIVVGATVFLVGSLLVYNTFSVILVERIEQIGILKTLGQDQRETIAMFLAEGAVIGILGTIVGQGLGVVLGKSILHWQFKLDMNTFYRFSWSYCIVSILTGLIMPVISALIPAIRASKLSPIRALKFRDGAQASTRQKDSLYSSLWLFLIATVAYLYANRLQNKELLLAAYIVLMYCIVMGMVLGLPTALEKIAGGLQMMLSRFFGIEGKLAARTMLRNKQRSAILISMIAIGVFMVIGFHGLFYSLTTAINASVAQQLQFELEIKGETVDQYQSKERSLAQLPNVKKVLHSGSFSQDDDHMPAGSFKAVALDYATYSQLFSFDLIDGDQRSMESQWDRGRNVVVTEEIADSLSLHVGSTMFLQGQSGKIPFKVIAVIEAGGYNAYLSWNSYTQALGYGDVTSLYMQLKDPTLVEDTVTAVNKQLEDETGLTVARQDRRRTQTLDVVGNLSELINKMNLVVLLVSVLCLMNTMIMSVLERYKEIGMMRSIGATRSQIRRMILQEGILFALIGGLLGIAQGMFFSGTMVEAMESFVRFKVTNIQDFRYMGEILLVVLLMAYLAALYPAGQAAKQVIVEAIKGE